MNDFVCILTEPNYGESLWGKTLHAALIERLRQKRIPFREASLHLPPCDGVFIIAADYLWLRDTVRRLNASDIRPIVIGNQVQGIPGCSYSAVCSDLAGSMRYLRDRLRVLGKKHIALYGVNTDSIGDIGRMDGLLALDADFSDSLCVFKNSGSLRDCFDRFLPVCGQFDAVLCVNGYAAVSLAKNLEKFRPQALSSTEIFSCSRTKLSDCYRDLIHALDLNFEEFGKAAVFLYEELKRHPYMADMTVRIKWRTDAPSDGVCPSVSLDGIGETDRLYGDEEMRDMIRTDRLLDIADGTDRQILSLFARGKTAEEVAEQCFLTVGGVKYRLSRLMTVCHASDKAELLGLMARCLPEIWA